MTPSKSFLDRFEAHENQIVHEWIVSDLDTPVSVFLKLAEHEPYGFLLESVEGGEKLGRYTIIGYDPDIVWTCDDYRVAPSNPLDDIRAILAKSKITALDADLPPMASSGLFGFMGYDMIRMVEVIPDTNPDQLGIPDSVFIRPQILVIFDNIKHKICVTTPVYDHAGNTSVSAEAVWERARTRINGVVQKIARPVAASSAESQFAALPPPEANMTKDAYFAMLEKGKDYIRAGDIFQFVPSQRFTVAFDLPPFELYRSLRRLNPSPFLFYIKFPDFALVGSSPEIQVRVRDRRVTIRPIAGTRPRGLTPGQDTANRDSLLADQKEISEHLMLLDLGRNDVGKIAEIGSVSVTEKFTIEYYSHVMHIVSNVEGTLRADLDSLDALMSGSPAGTVSGAPKIRAMEIIDELEPTKRKFYGGAVGYLAANGNIDTCIALRTCVVKDGKIYIQAGGGVVADSVPQLEYEETIHKSKALMTAAADAITASHKIKQP